MKRAEGALVDRGDIESAVYDALDQVAHRIQGRYTIDDLHESLGMAVHDATTCLAELLPTGHES